MNETDQPEARAWPERLRGALVAWVGWSHDHYAIVLAVALALTSLSGVFAFRLLQNVDTDFTTLLPEGDRSVQDLERLRQRYGGSATVSVLVASPDFEANRRFVEALAADLAEGREQWSIREIRYREGAERAFLEEHKFLYVNLEDLDEVHRRLKARIQWEKCAKSPFCVQLDEKPDFSTDDIEAKYRRRVGEDEARNKDGYLSNPDGTVLGIELEVQSTGSKFAYMRGLNRWINERIVALEPAAFHPEMEVGQWGSLTKRLYEYRLIIGDAVRTAGVTTFLVFLVVFLYFRRFRPVFFMSLSVLVAITWTFAVTDFHIGYLNQQTAFLGSIIIGNGINFSLIFMARYLEERRGGAGPRLALLEATRNTAGATLTAAMATAIAYGVLLVASFKGFSQFGFMGGVGMLFCWIATYGLCPALLALSEKIRPFVPKYAKTDAGQGRFGSATIGRIVGRYPRVIIATGAILTLLSALFIRQLLIDPFEYNFSKLRVVVQFMKERIWYERHFDVFSMGVSSPLVVLTDSEEQAALAAQVLEEKRARQGSTIDRIWWSGTLVPADQEQKLTVIEKIRHLVDTQPIGWMSQEQRQKVDELKASLSLDPITLEKIPEKLLERLRERDGHFGRIVLVYPKREIKLSEGRNLIRFANEVRRLDLPDGTTLWTSGTPVVFADMLRAVVKDGPLTTVVCYLGVIVALLINFRSLRTSLFLMAFLTYGLVLLGGAMGLLDLKVNFFNFIVIPITVGIGVDYHINVYKRYQLDGKRSIRGAVVHTGGAVLLCSLTTIIGYGTMMLSATPAMRSFGLMAVIGEITCLTSALLLKPAFLVLGERRRARREGEDGQAG